MAIASSEPPRRLDQGMTLCLNGDLTHCSDASLKNDIYPITPPAEVDCDHRFLSLPSPKPIEPNAKPLVAVIGVGYVGTHLVSVFSREYDTLGFDVSERRVRELRGVFAGNERVAVTSTPQDLDGATHFLISVPTLLLPDKSVDTSYLRSALSTVAAYARPGATVVIESSVAIGMTRQLLGPLARERGFFVGMSPERVDPGRTEPAAYAIPKIVSGLDDVVPGSLASISRLYSGVFDRIIPVSKPEVAEMTKLYENCQRMMCIAYCNEMADACQTLEIDPFEVCEAASTKPFGYMPYQPSCGVGGHCIPVNPYYLLSNSSFPLLQAASETMARRPAVIAKSVVERLARRQKSRADGARPRALVVGVGFKAGQSTLSNSPGLALIESLSQCAAVEIQFADPLVRQEDVPHIARLADDDWRRSTLETFDAVIVTIRQTGLDFALLNDLDDVHVEWWCV
ncbi:hypothetical protein HIM_04367 [Hirsutella minnesotensis 3608]|uniref:UDP-glucose/GDP-mannose dehydrogenase C-terminal domain-containing protein n=1 Tax=Hirsutella minnesotensis 3608 TaxID=1043627 RepID=A0A0F7ZPY0_9HYPO|nr:hypothetical protein HIM_04367 [Hirsutella minnesotensis 3608]